MTKNLLLLHWFQKHYVIPRPTLYSLHKTVGKKGKMYQNVVFKARLSHTLFPFHRKSCRKAPGHRTKTLVTTHTAHSLLGSSLQNWLGVLYFEDKMNHWMMHYFLLHATCPHMCWLAWVCVCVSLNFGLCVHVNVRLHRSLHHRGTENSKWKDTNTHRMPKLEKCMYSRSMLQT